MGLENMEGRFSCMARKKVFQTQPFSKREQAVFDILNAEYTKHQDKAYRELGKYALKQIQIAARWAEIQNKKDKANVPANREYTVQENGAGSVTKESVKSGVNRAVPDLLNARKAILEVNGGYLINNIHTRFYKYEQELLTKVSFEDPALFRVYDGVYAIRVDENHIDAAKRIFYALLGEENCFSINKWENLLILMLRQSDEDIKAAEEKIKNTAAEQESIVELNYDGITKNLAEALAILIGDVYQKQQMPPEPKKKRQKKQTS